jgi:hypothetical protein
MNAAQPNARLRLLTQCLPTFPPRTGLYSNILYPEDAVHTKSLTGQIKLIAGETSSITAELL